MAGRPGPTPGSHPGRGADRPRCPLRAAPPGPGLSRHAGRGDRRPHRVGRLQPRGARGRRHRRRAAGAAAAGHSRSPARVGEPVGRVRRRHRHRGDRLLADRRRCSLLRRPARLPDRYQPGDRGRGDCQPGLWPVAGNPRIDQPVGELPERQQRRPQRGRVAGDRRSRGPDPDRLRTAFLEIFRRPFSEQ